MRASLNRQLDDLYHYAYHPLDGHCIVRPATLGSELEPTTHAFMNQSRLNDATPAWLDETTVLVRRRYRESQQDVAQTTYPASSLIYCNSDERTERSTASAHHRFSGLMVMIFVSHTKGSRFDPGLNHFLRRLWYDITAFYL